MQGQLIGVALSFLRNFGIFSGASGVLGALSRGVAAIGTDQAAQEVLSLAHPALIAFPSHDALSRHLTSGPAPSRAWQWA